VTAGAAGANGVPQLFTDLFVEGASVIAEHGAISVRTLMAGPLAAEMQT
jgi:hypothetical protein